MLSPEAERLVLLAQADAYVRVALTALANANNVLEEPIAMRARVADVAFQEYAGTVLSAMQQLRKAREYGDKNLTGIRVRR